MRTKTFFEALLSIAAVHCSIVTVIAANSREGAFKEREKSAFSSTFNWLSGNFQERIAQISEGANSIIDSISSSRNSFISPTEEEMPTTTAVKTQRELCRLSISQHNQCIGKEKTQVYVNAVDGKWPTGFSWVLIRDQSKSVSSESASSTMYVENGLNAVDYESSTRCSRFSTEICLDGQYIMYVNLDESSALDTSAVGAEICGKAVTVGEAVALTMSRGRCIEQEYEMKHTPLKTTEAIAKTSAPITPEKTVDESLSSEEGLLLAKGIPDFSERFVPPSFPLEGEVFKSNIAENLLSALSLSLSLEYDPTSMPSNMPSSSPSSLPSSVPSSTPSAVPSSNPTVVPSSTPTVVPSSNPTVVPSSTPTVVPSSNPSSTPSSVPSATPSSEPTTTPTGIPTLGPTAEPSSSPSLQNRTEVKPRIMEFTLEEIQRESVVANVEVKTGYPRLGGKVYCYSYLGDNKPESTFEIISRGSSNTFYATEIGQRVMTSVLIDGLVPSTGYSVFCIAVDSTLESGDDLKRVIELGQGALTQCCRLVSFTSAPSYVYGDFSTKYKSTESSRYTFKYVLQALPDEDGTVIVTPKYADVGDDVKFIPAFQTFTSRSELEGSFVISASGKFSHPSGLLELDISGSQKEDYEGDYSELTILNNEAKPPAPKLSSVQFSNSLANLLVTFDGATDRASAVLRGQTRWSCSSLFSFPGLGPSNRCTWLDDSTVSVELGRTAIVIPGDSFVLLADKVIAQGGELSNIQQTKVVLGPEVRVQPIVDVSFSREFSSCDNFTIDATGSTGSGGRAWKSVVWKSTSIKAETFLAQYVSTSSIIKVPKDLISFGESTYSLTLTNFLSISASFSFSSVRSSSANIPSIVLAGPQTFRGKVSSDITIKAVGSLSSCATSKDLTYTFNISLNGVDIGAIKNTNRDPRMLTIPAYTLQVNQLYLVTATVVTGNSNDIATASKPLIFDDDIVRAQIGDGFGFKYIRSDMKYDLDAGTSRDLNLPEDPSGKTDPNLVFSWDCKVASGLDFGSSCPPELFAATTTPIFTVQASNMDVSKQYEFSVKVTDSANPLRKSTARITLQALDSSTPIVDVFPMFYFDPTFRKVDPSGWTKLLGGLDFKSDTNVSVSIVSPKSENWGTVETYTPTQGVFKNPSGKSQYDYLYLVIKENQLVAGATYTFQMVATNIKFPEKSSSVEYSVSVNAPPYGGEFTITPPSGYALKTVFKFEARYWIDDPEDYPLTYDFKYFTAASAAGTIETLAEFPIGLNREPSRSYTDGKLPSGLFPSYLLGTTAFIYDSLGSFSSIDGDVQVQFETGVSPADLAEETINGDMEDSKKASNVDGIVVSIGITSSTLSAIDCTNAPTNCTALNRGKCFSVDHTCGSCLPGYASAISPPGSGNDECVPEASVRRRRLSSSEVKITAAAPQKTCVNGCSGHGQCLFLDGNQNRLQSCSVTDTYCRAACECSTGYSGIDCSSTISQRYATDSLRRNMCSGLLVALSASSPSTSLFRTFANSLSTTYSQFDVFTPLSTETCANVLTSLSALAFDGTISTSDLQTAPKKFLESVSNFVEATVNASGSASASFNDTRKNDLIVQSMAAITTGVFKNMIQGMAPISYATTNLNVEVHFDPSTSLHGGTIIAPQTGLSQFYSSAEPSILLPANGLDVCGSSNGFVRYSVAKWEVNPYANRTSLTPWIQLTTTGASSPSQGGAYRVVLAYSEPHSEFGTVDANGFLSLPSCRVYDGSKGFDLCGCTVESYTPKKATFLCPNAADLCALASGNGYSFDTASSMGQFKVTSLTGSKSTVYAPPTVATDDKSHKSNDSGLLALIAIPGAIILIILSYLLYIHQKAVWENSQRSTPKAFSNLPSDNDEIDMNGTPTTTKGWELEMARPSSLPQSQEQVEVVEEETITFSIHAGDYDPETNTHIHADLTPLVVPPARRSSIVSAPVVTEEIFTINETVSPSGNTTELVTVDLDRQISAV